MHTHIHTHAHILQTFGLSSSIESLILFFGFSAYARWVLLGMKEDLKKAEVISNSRVKIRPSRKRGLNMMR